MCWPSKQLLVRLRSLWAKTHFRLSYFNDVALVWHNVLWGRTREGNAGLLVSADSARISAGPWTTGQTPINSLVQLFFQTVHQPQAIDSPNNGSKENSVTKQVWKKLKNNPMLSLPKLFNPCTHETGRCGHRDDTWNLGLNAAWDSKLAHPVWICNFLWCPVVLCHRHPVQTGIDGFSKHLRLCRLEGDELSVCSHSCPHWQRKDDWNRQWQLASQTWLQKRGNFFNARSPLSYLFHTCATGSFVWEDSLFRVLGFVSFLHLKCPFLYLFFSTFISQSLVCTWHQWTLSVFSSAKISGPSNPSSTLPSLTATTGIGPAQRTPEGQQRHVTLQTECFFFSCDANNMSGKLAKQKLQNHRKSPSLLLWLGSSPHPACARIMNLRTKSLMQTSKVPHRRWFLEASRPRPASLRMFPGCLVETSRSRSTRESSWERQCCTCGWKVHEVYSLPVTYHWSYLLRWCHVGAFGILRAWRWNKMHESRLLAVRLWKGSHFWSAMHWLFFPVCEPNLISRFSWGKRMEIAEFWKADVSAAFLHWVWNRLQMKGVNFNKPNRICVCVGNCVSSLIPVNVDTAAAVTVVHWGEIRHTPGWDTQCAANWKHEIIFSWRMWCFLCEIHLLFADQKKRENASNWRQNLWSWLQRKPSNVRTSQVVLSRSTVSESRSCLSTLREPSNLHNDLSNSPLSRRCCQRSWSVTQKSFCNQFFVHCCRKMCRADDQSKCLAKENKIQSVQTAIFSRNILNGEFRSTPTKPIESEMFRVVP